MEEAKRPTTKITLDRETQDKVNAFVNNGKAVYKAGKYAEALEQFNQAIAIAPHGPTLYYNRAQCYIALKQHEQAISDFSEYISLLKAVDTNTADLSFVYRERAACQRKLEKHEDVIDGLTELLESKKFAPEQRASLSEEDLQPFNECGVSLHALKRYEKAIDNFNIVIDSKEIKGESLLKSTVHYNRCLASYKLVGDSKLSRGFSNEDLSTPDGRALLIAKDYYWSSLAYKHLNKTEQSEADANKAIETCTQIIDSNSDKPLLKAQAHYWSGMAHNVLGNRNERSDGGMRARGILLSYKEEARTASREISDEDNRLIEKLFKDTKILINQPTSLLPKPESIQASHPKTGLLSGLGSSSDAPSATTATGAVHGSKPSFFASCCAFFSKCSRSSQRKDYNEMGEGVDIGYKDGQGGSGKGAGYNSLGD